jgi:signal transduction histidine kinase
MRKLLLLEDHPADIELITRLLAAYQVHSVRTCQQFDAALSAQPTAHGPRTTDHTKYDCLLADFSGPGLDGPTAMAIARRKAPDTPLIIVSGTISDDAAVAAMQAGAVDYLLKDRLARLPAAIERAIQQKRLEHRLQAAQRLENVGALAAGLAHDLNNMLTPVLVAHGLIRSDLRADKARLLDLADGSLKRGVELIQQMLTFCRGLNGERHHIDLPVLLERLVEFLRLDFPRGIVIRHERSALDRSLHVLGNSTQVHQVLLNFAANARDAILARGGDGSSPKQAGTVTISTDIEALLNYRPFSASAPISGSFVRVTVTDDGCGMTPETAAHIFEPFFTTKEIGKGTGLGLATSLRIATAHGGHIDLQTKPGTGSSFSLLLPTTAATQPNPARCDDGQGRTVLLVDDELGLLEITKAVLEESQYRVLTAANGAEALSLYSQHAAAIDTVVTDLRMPGLDGAKLLAHLRGLNPQVQVVLVTGQPAATLTDLRPNAVLHKPFTVEQLLSTLDRLATRVPIKRIT